MTVSALGSGERFHLVGPLTAPVAHAISCDC